MSYDPRAVKIPKEIKTFGATILDKEQRRAYYRGYTQVAEAAVRSRSTRNKNDKAE